LSRYIGVASYECLTHFKIIRIFEELGIGRIFKIK
jgi:hypothetical protein